MPAPGPVPGPKVISFWRTHGDDVQGSCRVCRQCTPRCLAMWQKGVWVQGFKVPALVV